MTVTVQEAEVRFSAGNLGKVESAAAMAGKYMDKLSGAASRSVRGLKKVGSIGAASVRSVAGAARSAASAMSSLAKSGGRIALGGAAAAATGAAGMLKLAADAETTAVQFEVLTGSADRAKSLLGEIDEFAASTPFQKMDIAQSARSLLAFGGNADTVVAELRMLGDIAAATGQPLGELSEIYGKAKVQGRLFAEDINQLTGRGVPVIGALAKEFGVAEGEVKSLVEKGQVGFPELQRALAGMTEPGSKFGGMMERLSGTTAGKFSTFVDNVKLLGTELGTQLLPYANQFLDWATNAVQGIDGVGTAFGTVINTAMSWYQTVSGYLQDMGTIAGVIVADWSTLWSGLFTDLTNYAKAAFEFILENSRRMISDLVKVAQNAPKILDATGRALGEEVAFRLGLSDEKLDIDPLAGVRLEGLAGFNAPERSAETQSVMADIEEELRRSREQRAAAMAPQPDVGSQQTDVALANAAKSFVSQTRTGDQAASKSRQTDRGSALSVFNKIQDSLAGKTLKVQEEQLEQQKAIAETGVQIAAGIGNLTGGLVPILG